LRVLIFHGYLLRGTGSNVYNASLARTLARLGHEVHLFCQDREAGSLGWVDAVGRWGPDLRLEGRPPGPGTITAYVPEIGGLLPVYVKDRYEGFEVKAFPELTDAELDRYLGANVAAVRDVAASVGGLDSAVASHLVMGPAILARAGLTYAVKIHGSALEYTVKPHPERFLPFALEGIRPATCVLASSSHTAESLWEAVDLPDLPAKTRRLTPGVDAHLFRPRPPEDGERAALQLAAELRGEPSAQWDRDPNTAAEVIEWFAGSDAPRVIFVGKLIVSKGVDLLLAAWPLVVRRHPGARLLIVGFGEYRHGLERLLGALEAGDIRTARWIASQGRALEGAPAPSRLRYLDAFLSDPPAGYVDAGRAAGDSVRFTGRLEHDEVAELVGSAAAMAVPSTFPEAFGMVAAEAAAAGVLPVSAGHSGLAEVSRGLAARLPPQVGDLTSFPLGDDSVPALGDRLDRWLSLTPADREPFREILAETAAGLWSWESVAQGVLAASAGRLEELSAAQ